MVFRFNSRKTETRHYDTEILAIAEPIVNVLFGCSTLKSDAHAAYFRGPVHFLSLTSSNELPYLLGRIIYDLARNGKSTFCVTSVEIHDTIEFYLNCVFRSTDPSRIGLPTPLQWLFLCIRMFLTWRPRK